MKGLGYGKDYQYAHYLVRQGRQQCGACRDNFARPGSTTGRQARGIEKRIRERMEENQETARTRLPENKNPGPKKRILERLRDIL